MESKDPGIIFKPKESDDEEYYHWSEFEDLLTRALKDKLAEDIALVYTKVFWVYSYAGIDAESGEEGIWVETEMEKFSCKQCGHCCLNLSDAYCNSVLDEDVDRWNWKIATIFSNLSIRVLFLTIFGLTRKPQKSLTGVHG